MKIYLLIVLVSIPPLIPLILPGLPITHDGADHVARIASFYQGLSEGILMPRWAENLNWGYGHPILMFLYPFSSYTASLFHFLGFSFMDSLKIIFALGFIASGLTMYLWAKEQFDQQIGLVAALFYLFAPYRFVDLYVRGAIGEHMAFIFPPLVLFFMYKFFHSKKLRKDYIYFSGLAISFSLLLLSHNAISLMFLPVFVVYALYLLFISKNLRKLLLIGVSFSLGFLLSAFFTIPAFFEGKYTLRDIVTGDEYRNRFVENPLKFLFGQWNYGITGQFSVQLGTVQLLALLFLPLVFFKKNVNKKLKWVLAIFLIFFVFSIFIQLSVSNFLYEIITTFKKFQFPWRFLSLALFSLSVLSSSALLLVAKEKRKWFVAAVLILLLVTTFPFWKPKGYFQKPDAYYHKIYQGTTDTGESAPIWSVRFMEKKPTKEVEVISGEADVSIISRSSTKHSYTITVISQTARIRENTLYFPGWKVVTAGRNLDIQFQDPSERGLITFELPHGSHSVEVVFEDTKLRWIANIVSLITFLGMLVGLVLILVLKFNKRNK